MTFTDEQLAQLETAASRLLANEPLQYVLGKAWFYGMTFSVDNSVLIPRPETEELVELIFRENKLSSPVILDIGTGSGIIAITLKKEIPGSIVYALDISVQALDVAIKNADTLQADIHFIHGDIFHHEKMDLPQFDMIISNPPYVDPVEKNTLHKNVLDHEPHLALFGHEHDPFVFYRTICAYAYHHLNERGNLYFEIPENKGDEVSRIVAGAGFTDVRTFHDMQGKERMVAAEKK